MVVLIWVGVFLALFYRWLCGGWFARVLMCMLLVVTFGGIMALAMEGKEGVIAMSLSAAGLGWIIGSIPVWCWRERMRSIAQADNRNAMVQYR